MSTRKARFGPQLLCLLCALVLIQSCASMKGQHQSLIVPTDVDDVDVFSSDHTFLGKAPGFVKINRESSAEILLSHNRKQHKLVLETQYRWGDSFWPSLILGLFSPPLALVSLGVDYWTGAAWQYQRLNLVRFEPAKDIDPPPPRRIAVAPVAYDSEFLSDLMSADLAEFVAQKYPKAKILPYENHIAEYSGWGWTHQHLPEREQRDQVFQELNVDHVLIASADEREDSLQIRAKLHDIYRDFSREKMIFEREKESADTLDRVYQSTREFFYEIVPNSIGIERSLPAFGGYAELEYGTVKTSATNRGWLGSQMAINLLNLRPPQTTGSLRGTFSWKSKASLLARNFDISVTPNPDSLFRTEPTEVSWYGLQVGLGAEIGLDTPIGLFYLDIIPIGRFDYLTTDAKRYPQGTDLGMDMFSEFGYSIYVTDRIHLQIYFSTLRAPSLLSEAVTEIYQSPIRSGGDEGLGSFSNSGMSLSYFFPEGRTRVKRSIRDW